MELGLCIEMALTKLPFEQRFAAAARLGFKTVEMWFVKDLSWNGSPEDLAALAKAAGVRISNTVVGAPDGSLGGGLTNPAKREEWLARARLTLDFNKRAGIPATIVCTGNVVAGMTDAAMRQSVLDGLKATTQLAEAAGVTLLLEPLNTRWDHAGYFLTGSDAGAELCRAVGSERMKLLFDCYHMQTMEGDLVQHIRKNLDVIGHFHSAGVPGRNEIFKSEVDYRFLTAQIKAAGWDKLFALEFAPSMDDTDALRQTIDWLGGTTF